MRKRSSVSPTFFVAVSCIICGVGLGTFLLQDRSTALYTAQADPVFEKLLTKAKRAGREGDWSGARKLLVKHAKTDNPQAKLEYALLFTKGWGVKRNLEEARLLLLQAVQYRFAGRGLAAFELGKAYRLSKGKDCPRIAFEWFSKALAWGVNKAHGELGKSYARGLGVEIDYTKAIKHYSLAIENGSASAVVPLFEVALQQQRDGNADPARGQLLANKYLPILESAAREGNRIAARTLGRIYERGLFVEPNAKKGMKWFALAASQGDAVAMHDLAILGMSRKKQPLELKQVVTFLKDSSDLGYPAAMTALGRLYLAKAKIRNVELAVSFLEKGARAGHAGSMAELAKLHFSGKHIPQNISLARKFAEQGALQKHLGCKRILLRIAKLEEQSKQEIQQRKVVKS